MTRSVAEALLQARAAGLDRLDAQLIVAARLGRSRSWLIAHDDALLDAPQAAGIEAWIARRAAGEPLAYLLGEKEFHGLLLQVDARVLVPRPDTEVLVDWALELLEGTKAPKVLDLGTGSGAIALAIQHARRDATVLASDVSPDALAVAQANAQRLGLGMAWLEASWWAGVGERRFDLVVSNPPYIAAGDSHLAALQHEPQLALTPGGDGLDALREIIAGAADHLAEGAWLLLEHGYDQADAVQRLLREHGFEAVATRRDLGDQPRCTGGHRGRSGA